jgi:2-polyprenyl-3-methyl-5-hydroxy-6-metoxy-1,4-benzoquinol methylase
LLTVVLPAVGVRRGAKAVDLGCGSGAFVQRLLTYGCDAMGVDYIPPAVEADEIARHQRFEASAPFVSLDFNRADAADILGRGQFDVVTAIEVIEHLENPTAFLRTVAGLLKPTGVAVVTTPNVDCMPARVKFLLRGSLRMIDDGLDPTHITPIFVSLLRQHYVARAGLILKEQRFYPTSGWNYVASARSAFAYRAIAALLPGGPEKYGDISIFVLAPAPAA